MDPSGRAARGTYLSLRVALATAAVVSLLYAVALLPWGFVSGTGPYWEHPQLWDLDRAQALIGWRYFALDGWRFPIFYVPTLSYPEGTTIVYTDSIPLLALVFKVWLKVTGYNINYLGFWMLACYALQGVGAVWLLSAIGVRDWTANVAGLGFALCADSLLRRYGHGALCGHFLILFALASYFRVVTRPTSRLHWAMLTLLLTSSVLITAYFTAMIGVLFAAALLESVRRQGLTPARASLLGGGALGALLTVMYLGGLIGSTSPPSVGSGFGYFSMNALAPFFGDETSITQRLVGPVMIDATGGQYEGFNYLGGSILALCAVACLGWPRDVLRSVRRHPILTLGLAALTMYAMSNVGYVGATKLYEFRIPEKIAGLTGSFRSSGRFFWPAYYVIGLGAISTVIPRLPRSLAMAVALLVATGQYFETQGARAYMRASASRVNAAVLVDSTIADRVSRATKLFFYPSFECSYDIDAGWPHPDSWRALGIEILLAASRKGIPTNSMYVSRGEKDCTLERAWMSSGRLERGTLYILREGSVGDWARSLEESGTCTVASAIVICGPV